MANSALSALFCKYALILFPPDTLLRLQRFYRLSALRIASNQNQLTICRQIELLRRPILTCLRLRRLQRGLRQHIRKRYGFLPQKVKVFLQSAQACRSSSLPRELKENPSCRSPLSPAPAKGCPLYFPPP